MLKHTATPNGIIHIVFTMNLDEFWPGIHSKKSKLNPARKTSHLEVGNGRNLHRLFETYGKFLTF
jgi:hypothetical protein